MGQGGGVASVLMEGGCEGFELVLLPDDRGEIVADDGGGFFREGSAHDENFWLAGDAGVCEGFANGFAFAGVGYAQPLGSGAGEDRSAEGCVVAVGVSFDDGEDGVGGGCGCECLIVG